MERQELTKLNDSVYEFYRGEDYELEVVAFHGLCFDTYAEAYITTWQDKDERRCWLRDFVAEKCPKARILSVSYDSCAKVSAEAGRMTFSSLGRILVQDLIHLAKVGQRGCPVVLIGYCLGGLVIQQLCIEAEKQYDQAPDGASKGRLDEFLTNVRAILYLDTPRAGSTLEDHLRKNHQCEGPVLEYLSKSSASLSSLNREFDSLVFERDWKRFICQYCHATMRWDSVTIPAPGLDVVTESSARRYAQEHYTIKADHSGKAVGLKKAWDQLKDVWDNLHEYTTQFMEGQKLTKLNDFVYEFHRGEDYELEVVAFHGLCSFDYESPYITAWQDKDERRCWLRDFIAKTHKKTRVLSVSYDSCAEATDEAEKKRMTFSNLGRILIENVIYHAKVGQHGCPVVLIGYCMGGLVIQQLCIEAKRQYDQVPDGQLHEFLTNVRSVLYLDTPHVGANLRDYPQKKHRCGDRVREYLITSSTSLIDINSGFDSLVSETQWEQFICWYRHASEVQNSMSISTPSLEVAATESSARRDDKRHFYTMDADHSGKAVSTAWSDLVGVWNNLLEKIFPYKCSETEKQKAPKEERESDELYVMHQPDNGGVNSNVELELIFFPGTADDGAYKSTWMSKDGKDCWLQTWLPKAFPRVRILAVSLFANDGGESDIVLNCENLIRAITDYHHSVSWCPLILVGHCKGGLVIKKLCNQIEELAAETTDADQLPALQAFLRSVRGVAYYGTSHAGYGSEDSSGDISPRAVGRLNSEFEHFITKYGCKELALGETRPTQLDSNKPVIVDEFSASHGIERNSFFPVTADHLSICKPESPLSNSFLYLKHFIRTTMQEVQYRNLNVRRKKRRGMAIIISMEEGRHGSDIDRRRFMDMAEYLKFRPAAIVDRKADELRRSIQEALNEVNDKDECILCCVAAHGFISDGEQFIYNIQEGPHRERIKLLSVILEPVIACPKLVGKPKVFVINACRGFEGKHDVPKPDQIMPKGDDCLLMYSCRPGELAWRREKGYQKGTLFVGEVTDQVKWLYQTTDVQDIFAAVKRRVPVLAARLGKEQSPVLHSSLSKKLSWRPR